MNNDIFFIYFFTKFAESVFQLS